MPNDIHKVNGSVYRQTLFIVKTDVNVSGNIFWSVTVDKDSRLFVFASDFEMRNR